MTESGAPPTRPGRLYYCNTCGGPTTQPARNGQKCPLHESDDTTAADTALRKAVVRATDTLHADIARVARLGRPAAATLTVRVPAETEEHANPLDSATSATRTARRYGMPEPIPTGPPVSSPTAQTPPGPTPSTGSRDCSNESSWSVTARKAHGGSKTHPDQTDTSSTAQST